MNFPFKYDLKYCNVAMPLPSKFPLLKRVARFFLLKNHVVYYDAILIQKQRKGKFIIYQI